MTEPRRIDLNAAREARGAATKEPVELTVGDLTFELPAELPLDFVELITADRILDAFRALVDDRAEELRGAMTFDDIEVFAEEIAAAYGIEGGLGNLPASGASS